MRFDLPALAREVAGILIGGVVVAVLFLIMVEGAFHKGFTDFDFAHVLGTAIQGTAKEQTFAGDALGVIGDTAGPTALYATLVAGPLLMLFHALVVVRLVRAHWAIQGVVLGLVAFLVLGFVFVPYADHNLDTPIGPWGSDEGALTPLVLAISSVASCIVGARCYDLAVRAGWWEPKQITVDETLEQLTSADAALLELPEQGAEQGRVRP